MSRESRQKRLERRRNPFKSGMLVQAKPEQWSLYNYGQYARMTIPYEQFLIIDGVFGGIKTYVKVLSSDGDVLSVCTAGLEPI